VKISEHWLREWVNPPITTAQLSEQLTMLGLTVDSVTAVAGAFSHVTIGEVLSTSPHPNASKLTCCVVNVGGSASLKIVCGAANVRAKLKVAVAMVGATLPGGVEIKKVELRGEPSEGMICSQNELQLIMGKTEFAGIIELPSDAPVGKNFYDYFLANDHVFDIEITPNRGDCLSALGIAREIAAANQLALKKRDNKTVRVTSKDTLPISITAKTMCARYAGRVIRRFNNRVPTPSWICQRLERANVRLIHLAVDVCNYVMLELGQPMHAFDLSKLHGKINVRHAESNEKIQLLDESTLTLSSEDVVIADSNNALALAGIMGGLQSGVTLETTDLFLEAAFFSPKNISMSARRHRITSDAAYRFERGVDFELPTQAIERATALLLEIAGGEAANMVDVMESQHLPKRQKIVLEKNEIARILGADIADNRAEKIFQSLGMSFSHSRSHFDITPPSFRFDMTLPIDAIEELARVNGYDKIPATPMTGALLMQPNAEKRVCLRRIRHVLIDRGYHEAMTYSFIDPKLQQVFSETAKTISLHNPLSQDMSVMRTSLLPGLLQAAQMNQHHQCERVRLFETGMCFEFISDELVQRQKLGLITIGDLVPEQWGEKKRTADLYDMKSDVSALLALSHLTNHHFKVEAHDGLHPGRSAAIYRGDTRLGWMGELHPRISSTLDVRGAVFVAELDLEWLREGDALHFQPFSRFPAVRRDIAVVLNESVTADVLTAVVTSGAGELLIDLHLFDVYQGERIGVGKKSVALGLTFQHSTRTLRDEEINEVIHHVVAMLERDLDATLRE